MVMRAVEDRASDAFAGDVAVVTSTGGARVQPPLGPRRVQSPVEEAPPTWGTDQLPRPYRGNDIRINLYV